jgi:hypothetical protein
LVARLEVASTATDPVVDQATGITLTRHQQFEWLVLGIELVAGFNDPYVIEGRRAELVHAALKAGDAMTEVLVRLKDERASGTHMSETGCITLASKALFDLHKAAQRFREVRSDTDLREEGVIAQAIFDQHGPGIAGIVTRALGNLRHEMRKIPF